MDADSSWHQLSHRLDLRQISIDFIETLELLLDELFNQAFSIAISEVNRWVKLFSILESTSPAKSEDNGWQEIHLLDSEQCFLKVWFLLALHWLAGTCAGSFAAWCFHVFGKHFFHRVFLSFNCFAFEVYIFPLCILLLLLLLIIVISSFTAFVFVILERFISQYSSLFGAILQGYLVHRFVLLLQRNHLTVNYWVMLERHWSFLGVLDVNFLLLDTSDPLGELEVVGHCSGKHHDWNCVWKFNDDFFPDWASLLVIDVMDFIEDNPFDVGDSWWVIVKHLLENLSGHDQAWRVFIKLNISCEHANITELELEVSVLLIRQWFDRRCVDRLSHVSSWQGDRVLGDQGLTSWGMCCHHYAISLL